MSDTVQNPDRSVLTREGLTREGAAQALADYFLANADAGNHAANDELIAELARRQRGAR